MTSRCAVSAAANGVDSLPLFRTRVRSTKGHGVAGNSAHFELICTVGPSGRFTEDHYERLEIVVPPVGTKWSKWRNRAIDWPRPGNRTRRGRVERWRGDRRCGQ
jgi:hypothetical protein